MRSALRSLRAFAGLAAAVARANLGSARPFKATVVLTERCDCRCEICGIWRKPKAPEPTPDDVARFLRGAPSVRWLNLTGGEIFLRDDVEAVCEAAVAAQPLLAVLDFPTTGQRTERIVAAVDRIARLGVPRFFVTVSVEGPPALHDRLRGREGAFERALTTYAALRGRRDVAAFLGLTLSDRNEGALEATFSALAARLPRFSEREVHVNVATTSGHYYDNLGAGVRKPAAPHAAVRRVLRRRRARLAPTDVLESAYLALVSRHVRTGRSPVPCRSLFTSVFVGGDGVLRPCTVFDRALGRAYERPLDELLATPEAEAARRDVAADRCPGCWSPCEAYQTLLAHLPRLLVER
ncbi:MAG: radical SAM protein [Planctomycetes bacterium]|nr:radical SAM protein [Planctomycetota bacterium]